MSKPTPELLRGVQLFANVDDATLERLAGDFIERDFAEGSLIAEEGVGGLNFFIVDSGEADVTIGGEKVGTISTGGAFGEVALVDKSARFRDDYGHDAGEGLRAARLELPELRRDAPGSSPGRCSRSSPSASARRSRATATAKGAHCSTRSHRTRSSSSAAGPATRPPGGRSSSATGGTSTRS